MAIDREFMAASCGVDFVPATSTPPGTGQLSGRAATVLGEWPIDKRQAYARD